MHLRGDRAKERERESFLLLLYINRKRGGKKKSALGHTVIDIPFSSGDDGSTAALHHITTIAGTSSFYSPSSPFSFYYYFFFSRKISFASSLPCYRLLVVRASAPVRFTPTTTSTLSSDIGRPTLKRASFSFSLSLSIHMAVYIYIYITYKARSVRRGARMSHLRV